MIKLLIIYLAILCSIILIGIIYWMYNEYKYNWKYIWMERNAQRNRIKIVDEFLKTCCKRRNICQS